MNFSDDKEKIQARETSLRLAIQLNSSRGVYNQGLAQQSHVEAPSISKILGDADKIYEWLIKD